MPDSARAPVALRRLPLLALGAVSLLAGIAGGVARLGVSTPSSASAASGHGVLMTLGFLGTLVSLERAVALRLPWGFVAPALSGVGGAAVLAGLPQPVPGLVFAAAAAWFCGVYLSLWSRQPAVHVAVQAVGALAWWGGAILWMRGGSMATLVPWLVAFLVLTIVGERLELARVAFLGARVRDGLLMACAVLIAGVTLTMLDPAVGGRMLGGGLLGLATWLARHDVARHTIRARGLAKYMATCLLAGYAWLAVAGVLWLVEGSVVDGPAYDVALHAVFLGFVMSMVFGHAPVILPAVLRVRLPHHRRDYGIVALLHVSLLVRIVGDATGAHDIRVWGGIGGAAALLGFLLSSLLSATEQPGKRSATRPARRVESSPQRDGAPAR